MNKAKWYKPLLEKVYDSYSDRIIVFDAGGFSFNPEIKEALKKDFLLHEYVNEIKLRLFMEKNRGSRMLIIKKPDVSYLPFDIEEKSEVVVWNERDADTGYQYGNISQGKSDEFLESLISGVYHLLASIDKNLNNETVPWGTIGYEWGKVSFLIDKYRYICSYIDEPKTIDFEEKAKEVEYKIQDEFSEYISSHYQKLFFKSYLKAPPTVDKVLPFLSQCTASKKVLICFDGMGFQEWFCLKEYLENKGINTFSESNVFALLPTVTSISRRALFSSKRIFGNLPEEKKGFCDYVIKNWPGGNESNPLFFHNAEVHLKQEYYAADYVGIIFNLVDDLVHQFKNIGKSKKLLQNNLGIILGETELDIIINQFIKKDYRVFITSDHGSVWCQGMGLKQDKYLMEERAKRACIFPNKTLARDFLKKDKELMFYENEEMLGEHCVIFSPWRKMFGNANQNEITHGGMHLEEVVVPFVEVLK